ncbi:MAG: phage integrase N-terminal SAM-like domain-containing protein [Anaerolineales bacterium]|nr:phage integrase N-terminal SAM-like domain-containing protein [Anaerolineales bacterium]
MSQQLSLFDPEKPPQPSLPVTSSMPPIRPVGDADPVPETTQLTANAPISAALAVWMESRERAGLSQNTIKNYRIDIQLLAEYAGAGASVGEFTTQTLNEYLEWMRHKRRVPCSSKTLDRRITALKSFFRWLTPAASLSLNPAEAVVNVSVRSPLPVVLTELEISQAQYAARQLRKRKKTADMRPHLLLTLLLHTGLRKGETVRLVTNHLVLDDTDQPHLYVRYADKRHRHKERRVDLDPKWVLDYHKYAEHYQITERLFPWSVRLLEYRLEDVSNAAGLKKHISFEMLRWTCALRDFRDGMESEKLRRKLGLSNVQWGEMRRKIRRLLE